MIIPVSPLLLMMSHLPYVSLPSDEARKELVAHGLGSTVTVTHRDIMVQGFPLEVHQGSVDAVFLDLPGPWKVVPNAAQCLRPNGRWVGGRRCCTYDH